MTTINLENMWGGCRVGGQCGFLASVFYGPDETTACWTIHFLKMMIKIKKWWEPHFAHKDAFRESLQVGSGPPPPPLTTEPCFFRVYPLKFNLIAAESQTGPVKEEDDRFRHTNLRHPWSQRQFFPPSFLRSGIISAANLNASVIGQLSG